MMNNTTNYTTDTFSASLKVWFVSILTFLLLLSGNRSFGQTVACNVTLDYTVGSTPPSGGSYNMANGTISTCGGTFYDPGGTSNYSNSTSLITQTFCSDTPGEQIILDFSAGSFQVETSYDFLNIYDGVGTGGTHLWNSQTSGGSTNPGMIQSTSGCLTITFSSDGSVNYTGWQAAISCTTPTTLDCNGGQVVLTATGVGEQNTVMGNNFNSGLGSGWVATGGSSVGTPCGSSLDGTPYYWASTSTGTPNLTTVAYDVSCGGTISFDMAYSVQGGASPCEGPDLTNEGVYLRYSTDGGATWTIIQYWDPVGGYDPTLTSWNTYTIPIPAAAMTPNTQFQWIQTSSSGSCCDNWGIDNVSITANTNCSSYWYDYTSLPPSNDPNQYTTTITSTSTIGVWYTNGSTDSCYAEVTIVVPPGTTADAGPDQVICGGSGSALIGGNPVSPDEGATYSWNNSAGSGTIDLTAPGITNGQVTVSPLVNTTYEVTVSYNGCTATDQVTVTIDAPPTASNPAPISVECAANIPAPNVNVVTDEADDYTIPPTVTYIGESVVTAGCPETRTRTYRVTDGCGSYIDVYQTITIDPATNPVVPVNGGSTVNCPANALVQPTAPTVTDVCGNTLTPVVTAPAAIACEGTMVWVFTYTDCSGNSSQWNYTYTIDMPAFTVPANGSSTVNCLANATAPTPPAVNDMCGNAVTPVMTQNANPACEGNKIYTFTYTDCAGNSAVWTYTYTIDIPAFTVPVNGGTTVNCPADALVQPAAPAVNDACGNALTPVVTSPSAIPCEGTMDWIFTYTDCAGNSAVWTYTYTINTPAFTVPANGSSTVNCLANATVPTAPAVNDMCGNALTPVMSQNADPACEGSKIYTFTYTDCAGNTADWVYTYTIDMPAFTLPANGTSTVNCLSDVTVPTAPAVNDVCGNALTPVMTQNADPACEGDKIYTFTYTDCAGNTAAWTYTYTINIPAFTLPANSASTVNCLSDITVPTPPAVNDMCGNALTPVMTQNADPACEGDKIYTFTYTDCAGNTAVWTYTYTINIPPFTLPANGTESVVCIGDVYVPTPPAVTDMCGNAITPVMTQNADPVCVGDKIYTFTYTDCAGNTAAWTYTFSINDNIAPTGTAPANISITNVDPVPAPDPTLITDEADNCAAAPTVTFISDVSDNGTCPEIITRTYRITDACGNFIDVIQTITIGDAGNPTASNPAPVTVECMAQVPAPDPNVVTDEADDSGIQSVTWEDDTPNGTCPTVIDRRYRVTDICGNFIFVTQTITVVPSTNPVVPVDGASTVNCLSDAQVQPTPPTVTDVCGNNITPTVTVPADITCEGTMTWVFTYADCAGNTSVWNYTYTVNLPAFTLPANSASTVNCLADAVVPTPPAMTDLCGNTITPVMTQNADPACEGDKIYTFTYTDCAGNTADWVYTYTINIPAFTLPANGTESVVCIEDVYVPTPPVMTDMCGNTLTPVMTQNADPVCVGDKIYTFTYTDCAGNTAAWTYTFSINDNIAPTGTAPADISIVLGTPVPAPDPTLITDEADNCAATPTVTFVSDVSDNGACPEIITRTYQIEDACGNITLVTQTITIGDGVDPTATAPAPVTVECMAQVPAPDPTLITDEADNGPTPTVTWEDDTPNGSCPTVIDRRYRITDDCGNFIFVTQTITVVPSTNPVVPADGASTVNCLADAQVQPTPPTVTDVCGNNITPTVTIPSDIVCEGTMTWVFTYTDCAGNSTDWNYTYTVDLPTFSAPADQSESVVCFTDIYVPTPPAVVDMCGNAVIPVMSQGPDPVCSGDKVYTFTYTDCAGNTDDWVYTFTINDNIAPTGSNPAPISVAGAILVPAPDPTVVTDEADNCTPQPAVAWVSDVSDGNVCNNEQITRTYSITDDCGNVKYVTQIITILAVPPPIDAGPDTLVCADGFATLTVDNPWNVPISWNNGIQDGVAFNPPGTTTYTVTGDNYGCISTDDVTVNVENLPTVSFVGDVLSGCQPVTTTFTNTSVGESPLVNCVWEFSNGTTVTGCGDVTYTFQFGGLYDVTLTTTTQTGCVNSTTYNDYVYVENIPVASFNASSTVLSTINTEVDFTNTSIYATDYVWTFGDGSQSTTEVNPTHFFPDEHTNNYIVELIATSPLGCADTVTKVIRVVEETIFYVPNTFTPDGDNYNEYFRAVFTSGYDPYDFTLLIFDRWGEIIWESHNADVGWDGTYGGETVQDGTYTWTIEFKTNQSDERRYVEGHVNVIR